MSDPLALSKERLVRKLAAAKGAGFTQKALELIEEFSQESHEIEVRLRNTRTKEMSEARRLNVRTLSHPATVLAVERIAALGAYLYAKGWHWEEMEAKVKVLR